MKVFTGVLVFIVFMFGLWVKEYKAEPPTYYLSLTNYEQTRFNEVIWFYTMDTLMGPIRSNDFFAIHWRPVFYGPFITSQDRFIDLDADPIFRFEPIFGAPYYIFPTCMPHLYEQAAYSAQSHNHRFKTRIKLLDEQGIEIHQYPAGQHYRDSVIWRSPPMNGVIYVDGIAEVEGVLRGRLTIYSSDDMYLVDNIRYSGSDEMNGRFGTTPQEMNHMPHMLGLVSDKNIIIQNNYENGKENGFAEGPNRIDRHSIIINASIIALGESFTFQHHNDTWDLYQGPTPDERGIIHLTGGVTQWRRGYVHRRNHGTGGGNGTGYGKDYFYDFRFLEDGPPGLSPSEYPRIEGVYRRLDLGFSQEYIITNTDVHNIAIPAGLVIKLSNNNSLTVRDTLNVSGTPDKPVIFRPDDDIEAGVLRAIEDCVVNITHAKFIGIDVEFTAREITLNNCTFTNAVNLTGFTTIDSCSFSLPVSVENWDRTTISRSVFNDGISLYAGNGNIDFVNNTVTGSRGAGIELRRFGTARLANNIIAFNRDGIVNRHWLQPQIEYCDVYRNTRDDFDGCAPGEGCISADPLFIKAQQNDYRLWSQSPCLDAGDPASPCDPDGSVTDMGVYYIDKNVGVEEEAIVPQEFTFSAYPNPFNSRTTLNFRLPEATEVNIAIFDLSGRQVAVLAYGAHSAGSFTVAWDGISMPSGIYMAVVKAGNYTETRKLVLMR